jgi:hypothetical protein
VAAKKKVAGNLKKVRPNFAGPLATLVLGAASRVPLCLVSSAAITPHATRTVASAPSVVRQPKASLQAWKAGVAMIAPNG